MKKKKCQLFYVRVFKTVLPKQWLVYLIEVCGNPRLCAAVLPARAAQFMRFLYALLLRGGQYG